MNIEQGIPNEEGKKMFNTQFSMFNKKVTDNCRHCERSEALSAVGRNPMRYEEAKALASWHIS